VSKCLWCVLVSAQRINNPLCFHSYTRNTHTPPPPPRCAGQRRAARTRPSSTSPTCLCGAASSAAQTRNASCTSGVVCVCVCVCVCARVCACTGVLCAHMRPCTGGPPPPPPPPPRRPEHHAVLVSWMMGGVRSQNVTRLCARRGVWGAWQGPVAAGPQHTRVGAAAAAGRALSAQRAQVGAACSLCELACAHACGQSAHTARTRVFAISLLLLLLLCVRAPQDGGAQGRQGAAVWRLLRQRARRQVCVLVVAVLCGALGAASGFGRLGTHHAHALKAHWT
jgi:hypothetical protein